MTSVVVFALLLTSANACCSWNKCGECGNTTDYCNSGKTACEGSCKGMWCPDGPAPSPPPSPSPSPPPSPPSSQGIYCPQQSDMNEEATSGIEWNKNGWIFSGSARVSSKTSWNLLGGSIEFDMDVSGVNNYVNTNLYTSSPSVANVGVSTYCDIQKSAAGKPSCMEMDIIENNGQCASATTIHTFATDGQPNNGKCDRWGCQVGSTLPAKLFHVKAAFGNDGSMRVTLNGNDQGDYHPKPADESNKVVVDTMKSVGAVIESSQWYGWAPSASTCPSGDKSGLDSSRLKVSNVVVKGTVVQGPIPTTCQALALELLHNTTTTASDASLRVLV